MSRCSCREIIFPAPSACLFVFSRGGRRPLCLVLFVVHEFVVHDDEQRVFGARCLRPIESGTCSLGGAGSKHPPHSVTLGTYKNQSLVKLL